MTGVSVVVFFKNFEVKIETFDPALLTVREERERRGRDSKRKGKD